MPKHSRSSSIEIKSVDLNGIVIGYGTKEYYVYGGNEYLKMITNTELDCTVVHTRENRAMLTIENIRHNRNVVCRGINPLKYKNSDEWVEDD